MSKAAWAWPTMMIKEEEVPNLEQVSRLQWQNNQRMSSASYCKALQNLLEFIGVKF
jgi:hypothetical protein